MGTFVAFCTLSRVEQPRLHPRSILKTKDHRATRLWLNISSVHALNVWPPFLLVLPNLLDCSGRNESPLVHPSLKKP